MSQPTPCYHCGEPVPAGSSWCSTILGEQRAMCCPGCQAVADAIVAGGLESYYTHRTESSANPEALPQALQDELEMLDRSDVQQRYVRSEGDRQQIELLIEGISCAACGWLIEKRLVQMPGVLEATLNLGNNRLNLSWSAADTRLSALLGEIKRIGYAAHPYEPDKASEQIARENRQYLRRLGLAGLMFMQVMMATMALWDGFNQDMTPEMAVTLRWAALLMTTPVVLYSCAPFFRGAWRDLKNRRLSMDVSVSMAIGSAYGAGIWATLTNSGEIYFDSVTMFAFFLLAGRYLERRARQRTVESTAKLVNLLPPSTIRVDEQGQPQRIMLEEVRSGDLLEIKPGESIPADGVITRGVSSIDESALSGEYLPLAKQVGDQVTAGTMNVEGPLQIQVSAVGTETRLSAIVRLLERAQADKPRLAQLADQVAQYFLITVLLAIVLVGGAWWWLVNGETAFWIIIAMLVATCPCALSLATPTALTTATGSLQKLGLLITRGHVLEGLNRIDTVILDKTGTLTEGRMTLERILPFPGHDGEQALLQARMIESRSEHPIARAFGRSAAQADSVTSHPGLGLEGLCNDQLLRIGKPGYVAELGSWSAPAVPDEPGQWLLLGDAQGPIAWFVLNDRLRTDAGQLIRQLRDRGLRVVLLSGDHAPVVERMAHNLGIEEAIGNATPADKLAFVQQLQDQGAQVLMLGDGVNDVPVLASANISVAMGEASDLAKTSADAVLLSSHLQVLSDTFTVARRTRRIMIQNLFWAGAYNAGILPLAALGLVSPALAAAGMSASSLLVVLNALRLSRLPRSTRRPSSKPLQEQFA
ncbi:heavy metal translocating P-type ATPase [Halopseudomonas bauzanensis]|uniref:Cadmium-translocating P-type ATPase n=1 Tax=Halopseudomonas bauzanensis TaxID=653930 RepID=A0A4U0YG91_9GAMM|nr:heavy metal translocating P-type ATPase [Halopseudomonas bauzanensis]TKA90932.1 cadmium-translocating P-type ATPase [Halopseudomonas bauzanensis]